MERPRVCTIDVADEVTQDLLDRRFNCIPGTLGRLIEFDGSHRESLCLLQHSFPENLHELDVVVIDLQEIRSEPYDPAKHRRKKAQGHVQRALLSSYPETVFDPRALSAGLLGARLQKFREKDSFLIVFADSYESVEYHPVAITPLGVDRERPEVHSRYDFYSALPEYENIAGTDTEVSRELSPELMSLLSKHNLELTYSIAFEHPTRWTNQGSVKRSDFAPLITSASGQIVSFLAAWDNCIVFLFPRIQRKSEFLVELLENVLPGFSPALFPDSGMAAWLREERYWLLNESVLREERLKLIEKFNTQLGDIESRLQENQERYQFLHDLLRETGDELVRAVEIFLKWLGFKNVVNVDELNPGLKEEDLQIEDEPGLLVIEVKGIGGTSTDSDCSQIGKIKYRRSKQRGSFDVFALYLVNHQRHLPAHNRTNPPFNHIQVEDARNDERGLLSTFDLFNLFFDISDGHVDKADARHALFEVGLVRFNPSNRTCLTPVEIHHNGTVAIIQNGGLKIEKNTNVLVRDGAGSRLRKLEILEIQADGTPVETSSSDNEELGLRLSEKVTLDAQLWVPKP